MTGTDGPVRHRRRFLLMITALILVVLVIAAAAALIGPRLRSPEQVAADAAPPQASLVTADATRRELVEPVVLRGRLAPGKSTPVPVPATAVGPDSVVTKVPVKKGNRLREGRVVLERAGQPMIVLNLAFPLYRDVTAGLAGPDVKEIQRALRRVGYSVTVTGTFDTATQRQVSRFYRDRGYPSGAGGGEGTATEEAAVDAATTALAAAKKAKTGVAEAQAVVDAADQTLRTARLAVTSRIPQAGVLVTDGANKKVTTVRARVGQVLTDPDAVLLELDGQASTVVAIADRDQAALLRKGLPATAVDDLTGDEADTEITSIGTQPVAGTDGSNGFEVRFAFTGDPIGGGVDRSLRLDVAVTSRGSGDGGEVLAVPVTALYSRPDGSTFVTVVPASGEPVDVTVTTGQIAGGWVEIVEGDESLLTDGVPVVVGSSAS
ncbi:MULTISPECIES: peptidoglycan-binding protein [Actinoplanes]|uniref:peptidoglycan-binding protein n=1 Tax=Actinoplanes TaxID=1865 RepID=UPI000695B2DE|nr:MULTISPECIES: peptidoglycan-binding protein [Actinoplanes]GLY07732.1 hypothetical protein Acsp01_81110 [Actinoplanes sp. NBRC 101535]